MTQETANSENLVDATFVNTHAGWMFALAHNLLGDAALAEDAVQDALIAAHTRGNFEGRSDIRTWLHRVTLNAALAIRRKRGTTHRDIDSLQPAFDANACRIEEPWGELRNTDDVLQQRELAEFVRRSVQMLPDDYRVCLQLRDIEELSVSDTAAMLGISEQNVKVRTHRARAALKRLLEPLLRGQPVADITTDLPAADVEPGFARTMKGLMLAAFPMMITCEQFEDFIADYLAGGLSAYQRRLFDFHVRTCRECREYLAAYQRAREMAGAACKLVNDVKAAPADLVRAVVSALGV